MFLVVKSCCSNICPMASLPQESDKSPTLKLNIAQKEVLTLKPTVEKGKGKENIAEHSGTLEQYIKTM